ncbi:MAG: acyl-CoA dehydrogenase family protein [Bacteroidota bacterium]
MSFFNEDHHLFRQTVRDFLEKEIKPHIDKMEDDRKIPKEMYRKFGEMGLFGLSLEEKYGGTNVDVWYTVILHEEMSRLNSGGFSAAMGAHFFLAMTHINSGGSEKQKEAYLIPGIKGERVGCMAVTEPFGGSDVQAIRTTAVKEGDHYIVNGSKTFITNGVYSDYIVAAVKTDPDSSSKGISMLIIDRNTPGVSAVKLNKLGWHASDTGEIAFDNVKVPVKNLLGQENMGFFYIMQHFVTERLAMAIGAVSVAQYALDLTLKYISEREAFGRKINKFQVLRHRVAQMAAEIELNRQFVYSLYHRVENGDYLVKEASMAKLLSTQLCDNVTFQCLQMYGGYGYMEDYPIARMWRDSRLGQIGGGTSEILCEIIAKMIIDGQNYVKPKSTKSASAKAEA